MTSLRLLIIALCVAPLLTSCKPQGRVDSRYPTVSQQDAYDVAWGLPPRKSRGNPTIRTQYRARADEYSAPMSAPAPAAAPFVPSSAPAAPVEQISPAIPANLR